ncbi:hypothetical protein HPC49_20520 [Pyxidicoccus fallax]|uniref:Uncharacterized protein n=1 Tax=Pyxidicoccus fallax TaxID=394095 RepID=A0A848LGR8_9BACT|nr:hypothetical protein [Pyxidicoccus fallax]NMO16625.1 hypothetical protein [Pyxidicoccus fallax]NPC80598.1 hypothetical protein [Pyxidicoccus fallax]
MNRLLPIRLGCLVLGLVLGPAEGLAFEWLPEFQSLSEEEPDAFEGPERLGSEYTSDIHSYAKPLEWEYAWLTSDIAFDGVIGSTSATQFLMDSRAKAWVEIIPGRLDFRFTWLDHGDQERESRHVVLEIVTWLHRAVGLSVYGEPAMHKRQADLGAALLLRPGPRHEVRLFYTRVDLVRGTRSDRQETFAEGGAPWTAGLVGRVFRAPESGSRDFLEYAVRWEGSTRWRFLDEQSEYGYARRFASLFLQVDTGRGFDVALRLQADRKWESRQALESGADVVEERWRTDRLLALVRAVVRGRGLLEGWEFSPGVHLALRRWNINGRVLAYNEVLPHLWVETPTAGLGADATLRGLLGYEATYHGESGAFEEALGERYRPSREDYDGILHHRLNTGLQVAVGTRAALRLMVTWDLDRSTANGRLWQGGVGQLRVSF